MCLFNTYLSCVLYPRPQEYKDDCDLVPTSKVHILVYYRTSITDYNAVCFVRATDGETSRMNSQGKFLIKF